MQNSWCSLVIALLGSLTFLASDTHAESLTFGFSENADPAQRSAMAEFEIDGSNLIVTLTNTSTGDVMVPSDVLTAVLFNIQDNPELSRISAVLNSGSTVLFGTTDPGGVVGGEWAYKIGLFGNPPLQGISSTGLDDLFGPGDRFPGNDLQSPDAPNGMSYGIVSAGDNSTTGNSSVTGSNAFIKNSVVFTLGNLPTSFALSHLSNVSFQYGTSFDQPRFLGSQMGPEPPPPNSVVPEPSAFLLFGLGAVFTSCWMIRRRSPKLATTLA